MKRILTVGLAVALVLSAAAAAQQPSAASASQPITSISARWESERAGMLKQMLDRARVHARAVQLMVEIGTMRPSDERGAQKTVADLEAAINNDADARASRPQAAFRLNQTAAVRIAFAQALNDLDVSEVRFNAGVITAGALESQLVAAADLVLRR